MRDDDQIVLMPNLRKKGRSMPMNRKKSITKLISSTVTNGYPKACHIVCIGADGGLVIRANTLIRMPFKGTRNET